MECGDKIQVFLGIFSLLTPGWHIFPKELNFEFGHTIIYSTSHLFLQLTWEVINVKKKYSKINKKKVIIELKLNLRDIGHTNKAKSNKNQDFANIGIFLKLVTFGSATTMRKQGIKYRVFNSCTLEW